MRKQISPLPLAPCNLCVKSPHAPGGPLEVAVAAVGIIVTLLVALGLLLHVVSPIRAVRAVDFLELRKLPLRSLEVVNRSVVLRN